MVYTSGETFAGYTIDRLIGRGGMGEVYLARHPTLPRKEAVKILPGDLSRDPMFRKRFIREAELASSIVHPSIVTIYNSGESDGHLWIAMEYIDGVDAGELLRRSPRGLEPALVAAIATSVGSALDEAHGRGLLHRDIKPANILVQGAGTGAAQASAPPTLGPGHRAGDSAYRVLLADFGIAKSQQDVSNLTSANMFLGTVAYVAPEQLLGSEIDGRADQYSLAATLFQLLSGRPPFEGASQATVVAAHLNGTPPTLSRMRPGTSSALDAVLARGLAKSPDQRYSSCGEFAAEMIRALLGSPANQSQPPGPPRPIPAPMLYPQTGPMSANPYQSNPPVPGSAGPGSAVPGSAGPGNSYPGGPPPPPGQTYPGYSGGYPPPPPNKSSKTAVIAVVSAVAALILVIVVGVVVARQLSGSGDSTAGPSTTVEVPSTTAGQTTVTTQTTRPPVTEQPTPVTTPSDIAIGQCVQFAQQRDASGNVETSKVDCATDALTFYAATFIANTSQCPSEQNATLTFEGSAQKLCLAPNFVEGECYQIPRSGGSLADYRAASCSASPAANTVLARVTSRTTATGASCQRSEIRWTFTAPQSLGYCLVQVGAAP